MFRFNSLPTRIPLAIVGGILYGLLVYWIFTVLDVPTEFARLSGIILFLFYAGSRLLILFSGIDSAYYSRTRKTRITHTYETTLFFQTVQWVGKFYHYHDILLFIVLISVCLLFLGTLVVDWLDGDLIGNAFLRLVTSVVR